MEPIAIIGMDCIFPGAPGLDRYWHNICQGVDAITEVPEQRWSKIFFDPDSDEVDRFYCRRGGFVDEYAEFDPIEFGIMPKAVAGTEPDQLLSLRVGAGALRDAGYLDRDFPREKTAVIFGRGNYSGPGTLRLQQHVRTVQQTLQTLQDLLPGISRAQLQDVRKQMKAELAGCGADAAAGVIPNLAASRLANRLGLQGPAYTVDAACASTLIAVEQACHALTRGDCALALTGGVHFTHDLTFWATFCQLGALSRSQQIRPFSQDADGILAGEGIGLLVLKRLREAQADGDRIYAVLHGVASASDGRSGSLLAPSVAGQLLALRRAWQYTNFRPEQIGLLEAHGTATPAGDEAELETVKQFFGFESSTTPRAVIGSVKSMIGHTMPAAGAAGLIKAALSIYHGILPPTLYCDRPHALLKTTRFRAIATQEPWCGDGERIAAVNAFGFGGINAHAVLSSAPATRAITLRRQASVLPQVVVAAADSMEILLEKLTERRWDRTSLPGRFRLAIVEPNEARLKLAHKVVTTGVAWHGQNQIYFSPNRLLATGKLAFVFPGVDSSFEPQVEDVAEYFNLPSLHHTQRHDPAKNLLGVALGVYEVGMALFNALAALRIKASAMAGHSLGEWCAMAACNMMPLQFVEEATRRIENEALPDVDLLFLSVACSEAQAQNLLADLPELTISHDNCPHQVIFCGRKAHIDIALERAREQRFFAQLLPFTSGFHSPLFAPFIDRYRESFDRCPLQEPNVPMWSATTANKFPPTRLEKQQLAVEHLLRPVRFRQLIENMYADGIRGFVQVGTGSLVGFIDDTLRGKPHLTIGANIAKRSGMHQLTHLCAALWAEGMQFDLSLLGLKEQSARAAAGRTMQRLDLGVPLIKLKVPLTLNLPAEQHSWTDVAANDDPLQDMFSDVLNDISQAGNDVLSVWRARQQARVEPLAFSKPTETSPVPFDIRIQQRLDVGTTIPLVRDHSINREREGWPVPADRRPVVPMTMELELLRDRLESRLPGHVVIAFEKIQAFRWLLVAEPIDISIHLSMREYPRVEVAIEGFMRGYAVLARQYPESPAAHPPSLQNERACSISAGELYKNNWMFHGDAYRGITQLGPVGDNGITGSIKVPPGPGALLDNMGQFAGFWVMETQKFAPLAMPIGVEKVLFYRPQPAVGETFECQIRIDKLDDENCWSNQQLIDSAGRVAAQMLGWHTRRYQMPGGFFQRMREIQQQLLCSNIGQPFVIFEDRYDTANMREYIASKVLNQVELREYETLAPRRKRQWLNGRVAAKDAVRDYLWRKYGRRALYPKEMTISNAPSGQPLVRPHINTPWREPLHISLSHKGQFAAAIAAEQPVGIDIEAIATHSEGFLALAFGDDELAQLPTDNCEEWITRLWAAKEVVGKIAGTGLKANPRAFRVEAIRQESICVNGLWVDTLKYQDHIVAWKGADV